MATSILRPYRLESTRVGLQRTSEVDSASGEAYRARTSDERLRRSWAGPRRGKGVKLGCNMCVLADAPSQMTILIMRHVMFVGMQLIRDFSTLALLAR